MAGLLSLKWDTNGKWTVEEIQATIAMNKDSMPLMQPILEQTSEKAKVFADRWINLAIGRNICIYVKQSLKHFIAIEIGFKISQNDQD